MLKVLTCSRAANRHRYYEWKVKVEAAWRADRKSIGYSSPQREGHEGGWWRWAAKVGLVKDENKGRQRGCFLLQDLNICDTTWIKHDEVKCFFKKSNLHIFVWKKVIISVHYFVDKINFHHHCSKKEVGTNIMNVASFESCWILTNSSFYSENDWHQTTNAEFSRPVGLFLWVWKF